MPLVVVVVVVLLVLEVFGLGRAGGRGRCESCIGGPCNRTGGRSKVETGNTLSRDIAEIFALRNLM